MNSIESEPKITVQVLTDADTEKYFALIDSNRDYFGNFDNLPRDKYPTLESVHETLVQPSKTRWGIFIGSKLIGSINLMSTDVPEVGEIGYITAEAYAGQGYTTDAVRRVVKEIPRDYKSLIATINPANEASRRVLLKVGFVFNHTDEKGDSVYRLTRASS